MDEKRFLIKYCARIMRKTQAHMDMALKQYELSSGSYPFLLQLEQEEGISLEQISKKLNVDKSMSTRTVQKMEAQSYLSKIPDSGDSRAFRLYLTEKARECIPAIHAEIENWIDQITEGLSEDEKNMALELLKKIAENAVCKGMNQNIGNKTNNL